MPGVDRLRSIGARRGRQAAIDLGEAIRDNRLSLGLSQRVLAASLGISPSKLARWEHGEAPHPDVVDVCVVMQLLGHRASFKWYPVGGVLRDVGHVRLIRAFLRLVPAGLPRTLEEPMPIPGDLRAWDVSFTIDSRKVGVAVETNVRDIQALIRRETLKMRDSSVERLILVLADSHANRAAVAAAGPLLREFLPLDGRGILRALRERRLPPANGLLFVSASREGE